MSAGWVSQPLCGFDLETTGVDPTTARVVTASVIFTSTDPPTVHEWLADPGIEIPAEATAVHGVTTERARETGRPADQVVVEVADQLGEAWRNGWPVVAFNAPYDLSVLHHELIRHCCNKGFALLTDPEQGLGAVIDPLVIDKHVDRYRKGSRKLVDTCRHYGVALNDAHTSSADALAAMRLTWMICRRYPEIGKMTLDELQTAQAHWYRESQRSFANYLRRQCAMMGGDRDGNMAEINETLNRADTVEAQAKSWPLRMALAVEEGIDLSRMAGFGLPADEATPWDSVGSPLRPLLDHSDCNGDLSPDECRRVAPRLEEICRSWTGDGLALAYDRQQGLALARGMQVAAASARRLEFH